MPIPGAINIEKWIKEHADELKPPVGNKVMQIDDDFLIMVIAGPTKRFDFHYEPYAEWFYQLKGNMHVTIIEDGKRRRVDVKEGETWLMPAWTHHSPQRPEPGSIGIVLEAIRKPGETEYFKWFCPECDAEVHAIEVTVGDIEDDLPNVYKKFAHLSEEERTCPNCGHVHPAEPTGPEEYDGKVPNAVVLDA